MKLDHIRSPYLANISNYVLRVIFTFLQFHSMSMALLKGCFNLTLMAHCLCVWGSQVIEELPHYKLFCTLYSSPRAKFLSGILSGLRAYPVDFCCLTLMHMSLINSHYLPSQQRKFVPRWQCEGMIT